MKLSAWIEKKLENPEFRNQYISEMEEEIKRLESTLAERDVELANANTEAQVFETMYDNAQATISEYAAGWEKMRGGIKQMSSSAGNVRPEEGCRLVCVRAKELLAIKQPSVSKAGREL